MATERACVRVCPHGKLLGQRMQQEDCVFGSLTFERLHGQRHESGSKLILKHGSVGFSLHYSNRRITAQLRLVEVPSDRASDKAAAPI